MTVSDDEAQEPTVPVLTNRPRLSGPLRRLRDRLKLGGCAVASLAAVSRVDEFLAEDDPAFDVMTWLWRMHPPVELQPALGSVLLDVAHLQDRPRVRDRVREEGWPLLWQPDQADEEFHWITGWVILCKTCHSLYDSKPRLVSERIVCAAQRQMWTTPIAGAALKSFVEASLGHRSGHKPDGINVALVVDLLHRYHGARKPFVVNPRPRKLRGMSYVVDPEHQMVRLRFAGNDSER